MTFIFNLMLICHIADKVHVTIQLINFVAKASRCAQTFDVLALSVS